MVFIFLEILTVYNTVKILIYNEFITLVNLVVLELVDNEKCPHLIQKCI